MRLIDKDRIMYTTYADADASMNSMKVTMAEVESIPVVDAIPVQWLHKELIEQMYNRKLSSNTMAVFHQIIAKWDKENEGSGNH